MCLSDVTGCDNAWLPSSEYCRDVWQFSSWWWIMGCNGISSRWSIDGHCYPLEVCISNKTLFTILTHSYQLEVCISNIKLSFVAYSRWAPLRWSIDRHFYLVPSTVDYLQVVMIVIHSVSASMKEHCRTLVCIYHSGVQGEIVVTHLGRISPRWHCYPITI